jgi:hypothetical protein
LKRYLISIFILLEITLPRELKIASYNLENLFDMHFNGTEYREYIPNRANWTPSTLHKKLRNLSEVICEIDADIIGVQEIENRNALKLLQKSLKYYGCPYRYSAITQKSQTSVKVAILSRMEIKDSKSIFVKRGIRDILEVKFEIDGNPLYIFVNHWSSKRSPDSKRMVSALALKREILTLPEGSEYIILGDFNSNYSESVNGVLNSLKVRECKLAEGEFIHYNLWLELPIYQRWSYNFYGKKQGLDSIYIPYSLIDGKGIEYLNNSFGVFKRNYLFHKKKGYILRWVYRRGRHQGVGYSDHLPIFATLSTKPYVKENCHIKPASTEELLNSNLQLPVKLEGVKVTKLLKRGAILDNKIKIFGMDRKLELGKLYNMVVYKRKLYKGEYEIVDFELE